LLDFSAKAGLYRFSGGPDNWNIKADVNEPLYFSDVDTSRLLKTIPETQQGWEVLRNLNSAIHNWVYYFLPTLSYAESGYTKELVQEKRHDFVRGMLSGFFADKPDEEIDRATEAIWQFLTPVLEGAGQQNALGLRRGEQFLEGYYPRPIFHIAMIGILSELIQHSQFQASFSGTDLSPEAIRSYLERSAQDPSHGEMFANFSPDEAMAIVRKYTARDHERPRRRVNDLFPHIS
jgi:hypothetical protein